MVFPRKWTKVSSMHTLRGGLVWVEKVSFSKFINSRILKVWSSFGASSLFEKWSFELICLNWINDITFGAMSWSFQWYSILDSSKMIKFSKLVNFKFFLLKNTYVFYAKQDAKSQKLANFFPSHIYPLCRFFPVDLCFFVSLFPHLFRINVSLVSNELNYIFSD